MRSFVYATCPLWSNIDMISQDFRICIRPVWSYRRKYFRIPWKLTKSPSSHVFSMENLDFLISISRISQNEIFFFHFDGQQENPPTSFTLWIVDVLESRFLGLNLTVRTTDMGQLPLKVFMKMKNLWRFAGISYLSNNVWVIITVDISLGSSSSMMHDSLTRSVMQT